MTFLEEATLLLGAAVVFVPIFKRLGLGSVLGYLAAGVLLGPTGFALVGEANELMHFAEFGVVMLLFLIGLELEPSRLWRLRNDVFGAGGLQVVVTTALVFGVLLAFGLSWQASAVLGGSLALSSTAFALQLLNERKEMALPHGRTGFAILLFQDLAVIPMLAALPLLATHTAAGEGGSPWLAFGLSVGTIAGVILAGKFVLKPVLRIVAATRNHELSVALALLLVLGTAALMHAVGISMALGAFLAGVVLADSEYRHELEANVAPFQGLLLGLFFMTVGMAADFRTVAGNPAIIIGGALGLVALKIVVLFGIGRLFKLGGDSCVRLALTLSQGGEFAFVLLSVSAADGIIAPEILNIAIVVITISMALTPILIMAYDAYAKRKRSAQDAPAYEMSGYEDNPVIVAGFGRYGQMVGRMLGMMNIPFTALEANPTHVDFVRKFGNKVYYGDAARLDLLRAAKADKASIFVIAVDDVEASVAIAEKVRESFPHLKIYGRARNRPHAFALQAMEISDVRRETFASAIETGQAVLEGLGIDSGSAARAAQRFREHDEDLLQRQFSMRDDEEKLLETTREAAKRLEGLFKRDDAA
ncbi:MAG: monovalent cation:proton antiporter-2 (CPA2) family protein [Myxococcota bacterium]